VSQTNVDDFHRDVVRASLLVAARYGFVLGGGVAWVLHGLVTRPTEDIDLFSDVDGAAGAAVDDVRAALVAAGFEVRDTESGADLSDLFEGFDLDMHELYVTRADRTLVLSLGRLDRRDSPVVLDVGPVMSIDDLVGSKIAALVSRREVRDYIDAAAARSRYSVEELLALAYRHDPGLEPDDVPEAGRYLDRLADGRFARYGLGPGEVARVRAALVDWPR
jgi:hypothetical protein